MIKLSIRKDDMKFDPEEYSGLLVPKDTLYPKFWKNNKLNPIVARKLMEIADDVIKSLDIAEHVEDIVITGSIASYNWHEMSDIDLHIMLDFDKIDKNFDLVKRMLDQTRINWNKKHNILIDRKEVELYFQHYTEPHEANGIWSLELEKWLAEPVKLNPEIDILTTEKKAEAQRKRGIIFREIQRRHQEGGRLVQELEEGRAEWEWLESYQQDMIHEYENDTTALRWRQLLDEQLDGIKYYGGSQRLSVGKPNLTGF